MEIIPCFYRKQRADNQLTSLDIVDGVRALDLQSDALAGEGLDEYLIC
jgi:hypothetical protein